MENSEFIDLVERMRKMQTLYFKTRTSKRQEYLEESKELEAKVDAQIKKYKDNQVKLF